MKFLWRIPDSHGFLNALHISSEAYIYMNCYKEENCKDFRVTVQYVSGEDMPVKRFDNREEAEKLCEEINLWLSQFEYITEVNPNE